MELRIPRDLSLVAIYDLTPHAHPVRLSAAANISSSIARRASLMLQSLMKGEAVNDRLLNMEGDIQWEYSVAPVAAPG